MSERRWNLQVNAAAVLQEEAYGTSVDVIDRLLRLLDDLPPSAEGLYVTATIHEAKQLPKAEES